MKIQNFILVLVVISGLLLAAHFMGLWVQLGAHPWWSASATYIGIAGGVVVTAAAYWKLPRTPEATMMQAAGFAVLAAAAIGASTYGKRGFAASYAEDAQAGQIWYFGFIAFVFAVFCTLAALSRYTRRKSAE